MARRFFVQTQTVTRCGTDVRRALNSGVPRLFPRVIRPRRLSQTNCELLLTRKHCLIKTCTRHKRHPVGRQIQFAASITSSMPKNRAADTHMRRAEGDRRLEIAAHAHAETFEVRSRARASPEMRSAPPVPRRSAECTSVHAIASFRSSRQKSTNAFASRGSTPAFCGSSPVLTWTKSCGCRFCFAISAATAPRAILRGRSYGWHRTARPLPSPCWTAAAR